MTLEGGTQLRTPLLVAADGRASRLREMAGIKVVGWSYPQVGIVTTVRHEKPHRGRAVQHFLPAGPFAILPLTGNRSCVTWTEEAERGRAIVALDDAGFLAEVQQRFGYRLGNVELAGPRASWPLDMHLARAFAINRFALVGDAAHGVHPIAGQGLNLGLRDVAALTEVVADTARLGLDIGALTDARALRALAPARLDAVGGGLRRAQSPVLQRFHGGPDGPRLRARADRADAGAEGLLRGRGSRPDRRHPQAAARPAALNSGYLWMFRIL